MATSKSYKEDVGKTATKMCLFEYYYDSPASEFHICRWGNVNLSGNILEFIQIDDFSKMSDISLKTQYVTF